jgi:hypothetical protein
LDLDRDTTDEVFPSSPPCAGALVVAVYCPPTHYRYESVIEGGGVSPGVHSGVVELSRENLRGRVHLTPLLLRIDELGGQPPGHTGTPYAERVGRKLASGPPGVVDVDESKGNRSKDLPTIPKSFSDAPFQADDGNMCYLDTTDPSSPKLYINSDHGFVVPLLQHKNQDGRGRVRSLVVDLYGTQMMTQLVLEAAELYVVNGEIKYPWQRRLLSEVCGGLFDDKSVDEVEEMLEPGNLSDTLNQVATTVQRRRAPHEALERVLELNI